MNVERTPEVLTIEAAADYLRVPSDMVLRQAIQGNLPGRKIEDTWRFLRSALDDWLRSHDSRTILLQQVGALADDESLAELRAAVYQARERSEGDEIDA